MGSQILQIQLLSQQHVPDCFIGTKYEEFVLCTYYYKNCTVVIGGKRKTKKARYGHVTVKWLAP